MDDGYFPRGRSVLRQVQEERLVGLFYGQRALALGALDARNYIGTSQATSGRLTPFRRLVRTAKDFETIFLGTRDAADRVLAKVQRLHERVAGALPQDAGPFPAGTPYSAVDPQLMLWTVAVTADSALYFYELFVRRLSAAERDAFWADYVRFGELFGMARGVAPATFDGFRAYWDARLASDEMHLTEEARFMGRAAAFEIPLPWVDQPAKRVHDLIMLASMPARVRELYGLRWTPSHAVAYPAVLAALRAGRLLAPGALARGWNTRSFERVAATERDRIARGRPTPQLAPLPVAAPGPGGSASAATS